MRAGKLQAKQFEGAGFLLKAKALFDREHFQLSSAEAGALKLGMTPETLCRLFKRFSNTTPYQYLLQLKINQSVDLLIGTHLLIKEVGEHSGFEDPFQFSRIFKRLRGVSPDLFRRIHRRGRWSGGDHAPS